MTVGMRGSPAGDSTTTEGGNQSDNGGGSQQQQPPANQGQQHQQQQEPQQQVETAETSGGSGEGNVGKPVVEETEDPPAAETAADQAVPSKVCRTTFLSRPKDFQEETLITISLCVCMYFYGILKNGTPMLIRLKVAFSSSLFLQSGLKSLNYLLIKVNSFATNSNKVLIYFTHNFAHLVPALLSVKSFLYSIIRASFLTSIDQLECLQENAVKIAPLNQSEIVS